MQQISEKAHGGRAFSVLVPDADGLDDASRHAYRQLYQTPGGQFLLHGKRGQEGDPQVGSHGFFDGFEAPELYGVAKKDVPGAQVGSIRSL